MSNKTITIELGGTGSMITTIDAADWEGIKDYPWYAKLIPKYRGRFHAMASAKNEYGKYTTVSLHRLIMEPGEGMHVDHINGDTLDNRRCNLRVCTPSQNGANRRAPCKNKTGYYGVSQIGEKFSANLICEGTTYYLGLHKTAEEAARAYDKKKLELFGEYAWTNKKEDWVSREEKEMAKFIKDNNLNVTVEELMND